MVPGGGIEPPTRGFSIHCSTPELPGHGKRGCASQGRVRLGRSGAAVQWEMWGFLGARPLAGLSTRIANGRGGFERDFAASFCPLRRFRGRFGLRPAPLRPRCGSFGDRLVGRRKKSWWASWSRRSTGSEVLPMFWGQHLRNARGRRLALCFVEGRAGRNVIALPC